MVTAAARQRLDKHCFTIMGICGPLLGSAVFFFRSNPVGYNENQRAKSVIIVKADS
jgi:hypothetical protein